MTPASSLDTRARRLAQAGLSLCAIAICATHAACGPAVLVGAGVGVAASSEGKGSSGGGAGSGSTPSPSLPPSPVPPGPLPNLVPTGITLGQRSVERGETYDMSFTITNQGSAVAGSFEARVVISNSTTLAEGSDQVTLAFTVIPSLGPGESITRERHGALGPYGSGTYQLVLHVDDRLEVSESNEDDNLKAFGAFTIE